MLRMVQTPLNRAALLRSTLILALLLTFFPASPDARSQITASASGVKAAFLYNFTTYVEWPPYRFSHSQSPFVFGVLKARELAEDLQSITEGRTVKGREVEVRELSYQDELEDVHVLFVGGDLSRTKARLLAAALPLTILTVTEDSSHEHPLHSAINFRLIDGKVRFDVSRPVAQAANLTISSRLLSVARCIR